jgi:phage replication initiation protein
VANYSPLVLDGSQVKLRLQAERTATGKAIHIDWLRFTVLIRNVVPTFESLPSFKPLAGSKWDHYLKSVKYGSAEYDNLSYLAQTQVIRSTIEAFEKEHRDPVFQGACAQAYDLARDIAKVLGPDFVVNTNLKKGQDFYRWRMSIDRAGHECAWVGFLASSESPDSHRQAQTIHANIQGHACTFAQHGWREKMADLIDLHAGKITRADLALDMFKGLGFDMWQLHHDYKEGAFNVRGKTPGCRVDGDWFNGVGRSLYIGCRKSGKETNIYEKGDQLFGPKAFDPWIRAELRYGNQLRVLPTSLLRNPDDFFAGASDWHAALLATVNAQAQAIPCPQEKQLDIQTVLAEVHRNVRWLKSSAAATVAAAMKYMDYEDLRLAVDPDYNVLPGRLKKFSDADLRDAYSRVTATFKTADQDAPLDLVAA